MKAIKHLAVFALVLAILFSSGCAAPKTVDFTSPGVCAYVNGMPVYTDQIRQYEDVSRLYWQAVAELGDKPAEGVEVDNPEALEWVFSLNYNRAQKYLNQSSEDWTRDYYKVLLISEDLYKHSEKDIEDIAVLADKTVKQALSTGTITYMDGSQLDAFAMLDALSEKYGMTREQSANDILKAYLVSMGENETLIRYFAQEGYKGTPVQWDGTNTEECIAYLKDLYEQYEAYTGGLLKKADIIEKS